MMKFLGGILLCLGALHTASSQGTFASTAITFASTGIDDTAATLTIAFTLDNTNTIADNNVITFKKIGTLTDGTTTPVVTTAASCPFDGVAFANSNADITLTADGAIAVSTAISCILTVTSASAYVATLTSTDVEIAGSATYSTAADIATQTDLVVTGIGSPTAALTAQTQSASTTLTLVFTNGGVAFAIGDTVTFSNLATLMTTSTAPVALSCASFTPSYNGDDVVLTLSAAVSASTATTCTLTVELAAAYVGTVTSTVVSSATGLDTAVSVSGTDLNVDGIYDAMVGSDYGAQLPAEENLIEFSFKHSFNLAADDTVTFANLGTIGDGGTITLKDCTEFDAIAYSGSSNENIVVTVASGISATSSGTSCYILLTNSASEVATPVLTVAASTSGYTYAEDVYEFGLHVSSAFGLKGVTFALAMIFLAAVSNMML